jgi:aminoglycoside phosphotransferase (APT) family kinase protein
MVAKAGEHVRMAEAFAMNYVRERTSIPIPRVFNAYILEEAKLKQPPQGCIVMEYVDGQSLDHAWPSLTQKDSIVSQLRGYIDKLRSLTSTQVSSVDGSWCNDAFFTDDMGAYGPFENEHAFRDGLAAALKAKDDNSWTEMVIRFINQIKPGNIVLTHNDFAPRNILVKDDQVVAILDWENAGFYPEYWEYVKALYWPDWQSPWITEGIVDKILQPYTTELALLLHAREIIW